MISLHNCQSNDTIVQFLGFNSFETNLIVTDVNECATEAQTISLKKSSISMTIHLFIIMVLRSVAIY